MTNTIPAPKWPVRRTFASAAWTMLVWVLLGYVLAIPAVDSWVSAVERTPVGETLVGVALAMMGVTALVLWGAALVFATQNTARGSLGRVVLLVFLALGNLPAAFLYYFLYVLWRGQPEEADPRAATRD